ALRCSRVRGPQLTEGTARRRPPRRHHSPPAADTATPQWVGRFLVSEAIPHTRGGCGGALSAQAGRVATTDPKGGVPAACRDPWGCPRHGTEDGPGAYGGDFR